MRFIDSTEHIIRLEANTKGSPQPYDEFLAYLEFEKTSGPIFVSFNEDKGIKIKGAVENLKVTSVPTFLTKNLKKANKSKCCKENGPVSI